VVIRTYADVDLVLLVGVHREVFLCTCGFDVKGLLDYYGTLREIV
jgi:hypothetical protein